MIMENNTKPKISIVCNAFNQEKYIAQALDSFLMQETTVPFEILVHDDASTDSTADIIREYEKKYPDIIKPLYQTENQYSQGVSITPQIQLKRAQGDYIAFCEGDDYWTDKNKLQIQYDFMQKNEQYSICCHAYSMVDKEGNILQDRYDFDSDTVVPMKKLIGNQLEVPHYATMFARAECLQGLEGAFLGSGCSDMIIRLYCATQKDIYYINKNMSCYRRFTENSWTVRVGLDKEKFLSHRKEKIDFLKEYNEYTDKKYEDIIESEIDFRNFEIAIYEGRYKDAKKARCFSKTSLKRKVGIYAGCIFPKLTHYLQERHR